MAHTSSKEAILETALKLFMEKGYSATGISEIVEQTGVTKPTLYYFYNSKAGLFQALLNEYYTKLIDSLKVSTKYSPESNDYYKDVYPVLTATVETYFSFAKENKTFYLLILSMSYAHPDAETTPFLQKYQVEEHNLLVTMFTEMAKKHGNFKGKEKRFAVTFLAIIQSSIGLWHNGNFPLDKNWVAEIVKQFMHGIFV
ncbi:MAG: TetR/AcrR family transcriptional regulator [Spirochaetaceae bacterium]|nr:TetR/AcrR family transcriptional regulator [Spirochaetaceae bacterium]